MNGIKLILLCSVLLSACACASTSASLAIPHCKAPLVPITGFAQAFVGDTPIKQAKITWLETNKHYQTNQQGQFAFCAMPGKRMTLLLEKKHGFVNRYYPTQTGTHIISARGMVGQYNELTFQVPRVVTFQSLQKLMWLERKAKMAADDCHLVTTISADPYCLI